MQVNVPPLLETDHSILIGIHLVEELVQLGARHGQLRVLEGIAEFVFVELAVAVMVDGREEGS